MENEKNVTIEKTAKMKSRIEILVHKKRILVIHQLYKKSIKRKIKKIKWFATKIEF